jgi:hypothetical protein
MILRFFLVFAVAATVGACSSTEAGPSEQPLTLGRTVGANTHYAGGGEVDHDALAALAEAGFSFIRNDLTWDSVERERGVYDFEGAGFDELVDTCETLGLRILFILDYGNALYGEERAVVDDEGRAAFAAFAAAAASRYGGRGHAWEIWNEPNIEMFWSSTDGGPDAGLYADLVRTTAPALRAAAPNDEIVAGAIFFTFAEVLEVFGDGIAGPRFLEDVAATGALSEADEVTLHLYRRDQPEGSRADIELARNILETAGYPLPISSGEWGYSTYDPDARPEGVNFLPPVSQDRQASYLARMLLSNFSQGLPRSVIFKNVDAANPVPGQIEDHWGLWSSELVPKRSYHAVHTLTNLLGEAGLPETIPLGLREHGLRFQRPDGSQVTALWAEQAATWLLQAVGPDDASVVGRDGDDITPQGLADGAELTLESDEGPIYLIGDISVSSVE